MAVREKVSQINLLPQKEFASTTFGRILNWVLSTFRIIVIVTEIIVMLAFLSRFWLDAKNTDLNEEIKQKQAVIASSLSFEKDFKDIQERLKIFSDISTSEGIISGAFKEISSRMPDDVILTSITFDKDGLEISGKSPSEVGVQQFISNLSQSKSLEKVALSNVKSEEEGSQVLSFSIKAEIKKQGG